MTGRRLALIIGNSVYRDPNLARLKAPEADVGALAEVLQDAEIGAFDDVQVLVNTSSTSVRRAISNFFSKKSREDLLLFYFSGHGVLDEHGRLYLATKDTESNLLRGTAIPATHITDEMDNSSSQRQILILDCCHSGAFARGSKGVLGASVGTASVFSGTGFGRVVLTATDATQFAWEGDQIIGEAENSLFTHFLVQGIQTGAADLDKDGTITVEELYNYVYEQVVRSTPRQTPGKWSFKEQGELAIARSQQAVESPPAPAAPAAAPEPYLTRHAARPEPDLASHPAGPSGRIFTLTTDKAQLAIVPGASAALRVRIQNQGSALCHYQVSFQGVPPEWLSSPPGLNLTCPPGAEESLMLVIRPPRSPQSRAGRYAMAVIATCQEDKTQVMRATTTITVPSYHEFTSQIRPEKIEAGQAGVVRIANRGNSPETFEINWNSPANELVFDPPEARLRVEEGRVSDLEFHVRPRRRRWSSEKKKHRFSALISLSNAQVQTVSGETASRGLLPIWILPLVMILCLVAGLGALVSYIIQHQPQVLAAETEVFHTQTPASTPAATLVSPPAPAETAAPLIIPTQPPAVSPTAPPTGAPAPTSTSAPMCWPAVNVLNLRGGPGLAYQITGGAAINSEMIPLGYYSDSIPPGTPGWISVLSKSTGQSGWVRADSQFVICNFDVRTLPLPPIPAPPQSPTDTIAPTRTPTLTPSPSPTATIPPTRTAVSRLPVSYANVKIVSVQVNRSQLATGSDRGLPIYIGSPGATITVQIGYEIYNEAACPACIDEILIGFSHLSSLGCIYEGIPEKPATTRTAEITITLPTNPGIYFLAIDRTQDYSCPKGWWHPPGESQFILEIEVD